MSNSPAEPSPIRTATVFSRLPQLVVVGLWVWVGMVLIAAWGSWVELACHFVLHGLLAAVLIALRLAWSQRWRLVLATLPPAIYFLMLLQPWLLWQTPIPNPQLVNSLRVMSWNVLCVNQHLDEIDRVIADHPVDVLVLIEVRPNLFEQVPSIQQHYHRCLSFPSWHGNGIAVLTNRQDIELARVDFFDPIMPSIEATVAGQPLKLVAMHTWSPMPPGRAVPRDKQLEALKAWTREQNGPVCVTGDLNITPWAPAFVHLQDAGFVDSRLSGYGNCASWPSWLGPLGIPIDHALSFGKCEVVNRRLGPMVWGSDHRPILFAIRY